MLVRAGEGWSPNTVYGWLHLGAEEMAWASLLWHKQHIPKVAFVCWMAAHERLCTMDRIQNFCPSVDVRCCFCLAARETHCHLFFQCSYAREVLARLLAVVEFPMVSDELGEWHGVFSQARLNQNILFQLCASALSAAVYCIWYSRNVRRHNNVIVSVESCFHKVFSLVRSKWSLVEVVGNRYNRQIGQNLRLRW